MSIAVITGDIVNSRKTDTGVWLEVLKSALSKYGDTPKKWEISRGDSFQLEITHPKESLKAAIYIKTCVKQLPDIDVRISIGIGEKTHDAERISESNGSAFELSGDGFDKLGKKLLAINTSNEGFNKDMNLYFDLSSTIMNGWNTLIAIVIKEYLDHPDETQDQLLKHVKENQYFQQLMQRDKRVKLKNQSNISLILSRSEFDEIEKVMEAFKVKVRAL